MLHGHSHIMEMNFIPQQALLKHNKTKIFFTHSGYNGLLESITTGVPMLALPSYSLDQLMNCEGIQMNQYGQCIVSNDVSEMDEKLKYIEDNYAHFVKSLAKVAKILKIKSQEEQDVVYWVKYGFDIGFEHLSSVHYSDMSQFKYWEFDLYAIFYSVFLLICYVLNCSLCVYLLQSYLSLYRLCLVVLSSLKTLALDLLQFQITPKYKLV